MARPPFAEWSDTDHAAPIVIVTVCGLVYWLVPGVGQQILSFKRNSSLSYADSLYLAAMLVGLIQSIVLLVASTKGLGKSQDIIPNGSRTEALQTYHGSSVLYILVLGFAKCSAACSIISLTVPNRKSIKSASKAHKVTLALMIVFSLAWMAGSIIAIGLQCEPGATQDRSRRTCGGTMRTWASIFAFDAVTDLFISGFAGSIIWPTQAKFKLKLIWCVPFIIRVGVAILSGMRLAAFHPKALNEDPTLAIWLFVVLTQIQIFLSLTATGFPALKRTVLAMATNFGVPEDSQSRSRKGTSYALSSLRKRSKPSQTLESRLSGHDHNGGNTVEVHGGRNVTPSDDDSQKGILRHDEFDVVVEDASVRN